jgi:hypothetical protein
MHEGSGPAGRPVNSTEPQSLAEQLRPFLAAGECEATAGEWTTWRVTPADAATMFADLAARLAAMPADGPTFSITLGLQPWPSGDAPAVDALGAALVGVTGQRRLMSSGTVHYEAAGRTAAGLSVSCYTGVEPDEPDEAERAAHAAGKARS